jgi:hypothetical protein
MQRNRRIGFLSGCALSLAIGHVSTASAQSTFSDRVWKVTNSVLSSIRDPKAKVSLWRFKRPVSFNIIDASAAAATEDLIRAAVLPVVVDDACIGKVLDRLAAETQSSPPVDNPAILQAESAFLKERNLSKADLESYKAFRDRYTAELKRVAALTPEQAQAESYKIKQIETEWETLGRRSEFTELEGRISKLSKPAAMTDVAALRSEIYDGSNKLNFRLSVPINQWAQYDAWVHVKKLGGDQGAVPKFKEIDVPASVKFNANSCAADASACTGDLKGISIGTGVAASILAPQFDLPWYTKFAKATASLRGPVESCVTAARLDRLVLVQGVGAPFDVGQLAPIAQLLAAQRPFGEDNIQFSGIPDLGLAYFSTPSFVDGMLVSSHSYVLGFTTYEAEPSGK